MKYRTVEVELDNGRVQPRGVEVLPVKAHALLTILESSDISVPVPGPAGVLRFLATPDFPLTPEQFRASMEADFFEQ